MKFAILAAGIDSGRQLGEKPLVEIAAGEIGRQAPGVDAGELRAEAGGDHVARQLSGGDLPNGKQRLKACSRELAFAVGADIGEEEVAERDRLDAFRNCASADLAHAGFVLFVRAGPGQRDGPQWKTCGFGLLFEEPPSDGMHRDAIERLVEGGNQGYNFDGRILTEEMQRPGAVFATGPRKRDALALLRKRCALQAATGTRSALETLRDSQACRPKNTPT